MFTEIENMKFLASELIKANEWDMLFSLKRNYEKMASELPNDYLIQELYRLFNVTILSIYN
jgi:hypothetical protein